MHHDDPGRWTRRQFLQRASAAALFLVAHPEPVLADSEGPEDGQPLLTGLKLLTAAPFAAMKAFYHDQLGLAVLEETATRLVIAGGLTPITFVKAEPEQGAPWYHVAFNIPENKLLKAREWHLKRSPLIEAPERARDPAFPDDVRHFRNWNAHSVFFWDPAGNLLEYIARHDLDNGAPGPFTTDDILYASEIAFVVDDQPAAAHQLNQTLGLDVYPRGASSWWAMGDELGLLLCIPRRLWGENTDRPRRFTVHPTEATIRGGAPRTYQMPGYPYTVQVT
jgi:catechol 2,3-dioxygenase-like lactoylglutathione lyase family enzyme